jgi:hypothetical protein
MLIHQRHYQLLVYRKKKQEEIKNTILKSKIPENYKRVNLILGYTLFAAVSKTANVFGEDIEEIEWEPMKKVPKKMIELSNHILRVYFDEKEGIVEALEVLEKEVKNITRTTKIPPKKSVPKKKPAVTRLAPKKKPTMTPKSSSMKGRKPLPKIPNKDDE